MNAVGSVSSSARVELTGGNASPPIGGRTSVLPEPNSTAPVMDGISLLYLVQAKQEQLGLAQGETSVKTIGRERQIKLDDNIAAKQKAADEAREAASHHGFFDDIGSALGTVAKVAGVVAAVALAVCTYGAATPIAALAIAGAVLSTASFVDSEAHILDKLGIDPKTAGWIDIGMSVGGAACSGGAGLASTSATTVTTTTTVVAKGAEAGEHVVHAIDSVDQAQFKGREEDDFANALAAEKSAARLQTQLLAYLDELKDDSAGDRRAMKTTQGVIETNDATALAAVR